MSTSPPRPSGTAVAEQTVQQYTTERADAQQAGLFDEVAPPRVVLAGDSNSLRPEGQPQFNFAGFLQEYLSLEVLNASVNGGGAFTALQSYLGSSDYRENRPAWLVWEFRAWPIAVAAITDYRATIPAVYGGCREGLAAGRTELRGEPTAALLSAGQVGRVGAQGSGYYLNLTFSDLSITEFTLTLEHADEREEITLGRSTRAPNTGEFFLELSDSFASPLQRVSLTLPGAGSGNVEVRLCRIG